MSLAKYYSAIEELENANRELENKIVWGEWAMSRFQEESSILAGLGDADTPEVAAAKVEVARFEQEVYWGKQAIQKAMRRVGTARFCLELAEQAMAE